MPQFTCLCDKPFQKRCPFPLTKPSQVGRAHIPNVFMAGKLISLALVFNPAE